MAGDGFLDHAPRGAGQRPVADQAFDPLDHRLAAAGQPARRQRRQRLGDAVPERLRQRPGDGERHRQRRDDGEVLDGKVLHRDGRGWRRVRRLILAGTGGPRGPVVGERRVGQFRFPLSGGSRRSRSGIGL